MIKPDPDWGFLRQGMLLPAFCLLLGAALWGTTTIYRTRLDNTLETGRQELASIEQERNELIAARRASSFRPPIASSLPAASLAPTSVCSGCRQSAAAPRASACPTCVIRPGRRKSLQHRIS